MKRLLLLLAMLAAPAAAQAPDRVLIIYGDDKCPTSNGEEIVVCARKPESERYRIPEELRASNPRAIQRWADRAKSIEYAGRGGTMSCSPTGPGGYTGCVRDMMNAARAERREVAAQGSAPR